MLFTNVQLEKPGLLHLDRMGHYAICANRVLNQWGRAKKFVVADVNLSSVDSVHATQELARNRCRELHD